MAEKYKGSIITNDLSKCLVCGSQRNIQIHHIFHGANRNNSTKFGLVVPLCMYHHTGSTGAVHGKDGHKLDLEIKKLGQKAFEWTHTRDEFIATFGKNYL